MPKLVTANMSINNGDVERRYHYFADYCQLTQPDIIAVQEVSADYGQTALTGLAKALGPDYEFSYAEIYPKQENSQGVGVVSRLRITDSWLFDPIPGQNKVQVLDMDDRSNRRLLLANIHMEAHWGLDHKKLSKLRSLVRLLDSNLPQVLVGDFNAIPQLPSIQFIRGGYRSAHSLVHGREPSHTYPTDLGEDLLLNGGDATPRQIRLMKLGAWLFQKNNRRSSGLPRLVVDYAFVNHLVDVRAAKTFGHDDVELAHSDHHGLEVDFTIN